MSNKQPNQKTGWSSGDRFSCFYRVWTEKKILIWAIFKYIQSRSMFCVAGVHIMEKFISHWPLTEIFTAQIAVLVWTERYGRFVIRAYGHRSVTHTLHLPNIRQCTSPSCPHVSDPFTMFTLPYVMCFLLFDAIYLFKFWCWWTLYK